VAAATWETAAHPQPVCIDVADEVGAAALCFVVERSGRVLAAQDRGGSWTVSDRFDRRRPVDVLVCGPSPLDARDAVEAFARGEVGAVIRHDTPAQVVAALDGLDHGLGLVPNDVLERARAAPPITPRQRVVLEAVMAGQTNVEIAHALQLKPVTIKREVAALFAALGACRRFELIAAGYDLGFRKRRART